MLKSASTMNPAIEAGEFYQQTVANGVSPKQGRTQRALVTTQVRNDTGGALVSGSAVEFHDSITNPIDPLNLWMSGGIPDLSGELAILVGDLPSGAIGLCQFDGACTALVEITHDLHRYACVDPGETRLHSAWSGPVAILKKSTLADPDVPEVQTCAVQMMPAANNPWHAITWPDPTLGYPSRSVSPNVYPIKFLNYEFTDTAGRQEVSPTFVNPGSLDPDAFVFNVQEESYLSPYSHIWVYRVGCRWFTHTCCEVDESSSSSSVSVSFSSQSASSQSASSQSASSQSASSQSGSSQSASSVSISGSSASSSASSVSASSASSISVSLSSASSQSASSGGSSASSDLSSASSGGSSASSGGSSASSGGSSASSNESSGGSSASSGGLSSGGSSASAQSDSSRSISDSSGFQCVDVLVPFPEPIFDATGCTTTYFYRTLCFDAEGHLASIGDV